MCRNFPEIKYDYHSCVFEENLKGNFKPSLNFHQNSPKPPPLFLTLTEILIQHSPQLFQNLNFINFSFSENKKLCYIDPNHPQLKILEKSPEFKALSSEDKQQRHQKLSDQLKTSCFLLNFLDLSDLNKIVSKKIKLLTDLADAGEEVTDNASSSASKNLNSSNLSNKIFNDLLKFLLDRVDYLLDEFENLNEKYEIFLLDNLDSKVLEKLEAAEVKIADEKLNTSAANLTNVSISVSEQPSLESGSILENSEISAATLEPTATEKCQKYLKRKYSQISKKAVQKSDFQVEKLAQLRQEIVQTLYLIKILPEQHFKDFIVLYLNSLTDPWTRISEFGMFKNKENLLAEIFLENNCLQYFMLMNSERNFGELLDFGVFKKTLYFSNHPKF